MNNFYRVLRLSLRYRWTVAASAICALLVAVLWAANISTVYPLVKAIFRGQSLQTWVNDEIAASQAQIQQYQRSVGELEAQLGKAPPDERAALQSELGRAESRLLAEDRALAIRVALKPYIDSYLPSDPFNTLLLITLVILAGTILKNGFLVLGSILVDRLTNLATFDLRNSFYRRTLRLDLATFGQTNSSELISRFTYDIDGIASGIQTILGRAVREPLKMVACLVLAAWISWRLLFLSLIIVPVAAYLIRRLGKSLKKANKRAMEEMSQLFNILQETFAGIKVVKAFTMERRERRRFHRYSRQFYEKGRKIARYNAMVSPLTELMGLSSVCLAFLVGAYLVLNQETHVFGIKICERPLDEATLFVFWGLIIGASDPARRLSEIYNRLQRAAAASDRVYHMLDREPAFRDSGRSLALPRHHQELVFENVSFSYLPDQPVLDEVNLRIPFGETVAIVGPNGCGKTTLANLVPRFFDPVSGSIRVDGIDLKDVRMRDLRKQLGIVTQETLLFDDTVFNNIRYGAPHATREQVIEAAKQAHAHRFIEQRLEKGYDTEVGPLGNRLSGGQRQRIALARAILRDPAILILDEATSQVDLESEQLIQQVLEKFVRNRTTIIITHRLSVLDLADRIVVMNGGKILDQGTHEQLSSRCDLYRRLNQIHFKESA